MSTPHNRGSRTRKLPENAKPQPTKRKKGIPGRDFSGVDPDTGEYVVVRGNYKGTEKRQKSYKKGELNPDAPKTPMDRKRKNMKICGAKRTGRSASGEGICCNPAGWGTGHPGYGHCRHHGGMLESQEKAVQFQRITDMAEMYGSPVTDIDPHQALLEEVQRTAGHVRWMKDMIARFENKDELRQFTEVGIQPSVWIEMYHKERAQLVSVSQAAIRAGVAERQVRIAEEQGRMFAMVIQKIFLDPRLAITNMQRSIMPAVVRDHMMALDAGNLEVEHIPIAEVIEDGTQES